MQPQYLHIVISSERGEEKPKSEDLMMLQSQLIKSLKKAEGVFEEENNLSSFEMERAGNPHQTVFIPYHTDSQESPLDQEAAQLTTQLVENGKKKGCRSLKRTKAYISEKINLHLDQEK